MSIVNEVGTYLELICQKYCYRVTLILYSASHGDATWRESKILW